MPTRQISKIVLLVFCACFLNIVCMFGVVFLAYNKSLEEIKKMQKTLWNIAYYNREFETKKILTMKENVKKIVELEVSISNINYEINECKKELSNVRYTSAGKTLEGIISLKEKRLKEKMEEKMILELALN